MSRPCAARGGITVGAMRLRQVSHTSTAPSSVPPSANAGQLLVALDGTTVRAGNIANTVIFDWSLMTMRTSVGPLVQEHV